MSRLITRTVAIAVCGWAFLPPTHSLDLGTVVLAVICGLGLESLGRWAGDLL